MLHNFSYFFLKVRDDYDYTSIKITDAQKSKV